MYSRELLDHFQNPRNVGELDQPTASALIENPACGDIMRLSLKISGGRIIDAKFRTKGCVAAIASGSLLTEMLSGKTIDEARRFTHEQIAEALSLPKESLHAGHLAIDALHAALKQSN